MNALTYGTPKAGLYIDQEKFDLDDMAMEVCKLAISLGWQPDNEESDVLGFDRDADKERSDGPDHEWLSSLAEVMGSAENYLNGEETRAGFEWRLVENLGGFGLWDEASRLTAEMIEALKFYAGAPWVGHAGSWANSDLAKRANDVLAKLEASK